ncbi:MAG: universal stress protein [Granulosicoccaceae bacterium]|jgi:universal stress protein A
MEGYQNILCATDFSPHSQVAAERAAQLAKQYGAQLTLLHVVENFPEDRSNVQIAPEDVDPVAYRKEQAGASLAELARHLGRNDAGQEIRFSPHSARHEIVHFARERNVDLIVLATHGHHGITALLGSTANGVVHSAPCEVLVVPATEDGASR